MRKQLRVLLDPRLVISVYGLLFMTPLFAASSDSPAPQRARIYQLFVRTFGNTNETRKQDGTLLENGVGKFADINDAALDSLKAMGFTHLWLTGVLQQATSTDYSTIGEPADDPDLLKGLAGSPYAIKDYFDVCPDYAVKPAERIGEFRALLDRIHAHGLKALIDLVPNHVARSYGSNIKPELDFGAKDDHGKFFDPQNNFFYLRPSDPGGGAPLKLPTFKDGTAISPTCRVLGNRDGLVDREKEFGRVTGNNVVSWSPGLGDWYETIKLNYGFDFTDPHKSVREYPHEGEPSKPIPDTWLKMDAVLEYWQQMGVDGFRCDMSHMEPPEFWNWAIGRARGRNADVFFVGEAYNTDPARVPGSGAESAKMNNVMFDLIKAGFDAVYDDPSYKALKSLYDGQGWANDLDGALGTDLIFQNSLRYGENHDEVRLAGKHEWGRIGMLVGRPVSAILFGLSRGPVLLYNGQEVGEPAEGSEGFGGDDGRTSIFDYWSMPEMVKWVNGHKYDGALLSSEQRDLRDFYSRLVNLVGEPAFTSSAFFGLNPANNGNPDFGRLNGESASGHWLYAFLRYDAKTGQRILAVVNLNRSETLRDVKVKLPPDAWKFLDLDPEATTGALVFTDRLAHHPEPISVSAEEARKDGITIPAIPPLTPFFFQLSKTK